MKRILLAILALAIAAFTQTGAYGAAGGGITFTVGSPADADRGDRVTVPVTVSGNPGFASAGLVLTYDPAVLGLISVSYTNLEMPFDSGYTLTSEPGAQVINLIRPDGTDWRGSGVVANAYFYVLDGASAGATPVNLSFTGTPDGRPLNAAGEILEDAVIKSGEVVVYVPPTPAVTTVPVYGDNDFTGAQYMSAAASEAPVEGPVTEPAPAAAPAPAPATASPQPGFGPVPQTGVPDGGTLIAAAVLGLLVTAGLWGAVLLRKK